MTLEYSATRRTTYGIERQIDTTTERINERSVYLSVAERLCLVSRYSFVYMNTKPVCMFYSLSASSGVVTFCLSLNPYTTKR